VKQLHLHWTPEECEAARHEDLEDGLEEASPDDPIYSEGPSIMFVCHTAPAPPRAVSTSALPVRAHRRAKRRRRP
jgi:hypothetical protein